MSEYEKNYSGTDKISGKSWRKKVSSPAPFVWSRGAFFAAEKGFTSLVESETVYVEEKRSKRRWIFYAIEITKCLGRVMTLRRSYQMREEPAICFCVWPLMI